MPILGLGSMVVSGQPIPDVLLTSLVGLLGTIIGGLLTALNQVAVPPPDPNRYGFKSD